MPVMDEIKEQQEKVKQRDFKSRLSYFWDYYKVHTIVAIVTVFVLSIFISDFIEGQKDCIIYTLMLNGYPTGDMEAMMDEFLVESGYNPDKVNAFLEGNLTYTINSTDDSTVASMQKLLVMAQSGTVDFLIANDTVIDYYAEQFMFHDLRDILPADMLQEYEQNDYLIYAKTDPESSDLAPVGIKGEAFPRLIATQAYDYENANPVIAAICTSNRVDNMIQFLNYLEK